MSSIKCSSCGQHYDTEEIGVLGHDKDTWFLQIRCAACHTESLVAAVIRETRSPLVTDLTEDEALRLRHSDSVTTDDVLDMHDFLGNFDGNFSHLFIQG